MSHMKSFAEDLAIEYQEGNPKASLEEAIDPVYTSEKKTLIPKGFLTAFGYKGLVNGRYQLFSTEQEYKEVLCNGSESGFISVDATSRDIEYPCCYGPSELTEKYCFEDVMNMSNLCRRFLGMCDDTIVLLKDGTKTVVKCQNGETFDQGE